MNTSCFPKMTRMLLTLFLCTAVLPIAGCWDRKEINDVLLASAIGIDKKDGMIELSIQMVVPKATGGGQRSLESGGGGVTGGNNPTFVNSATGVTLAAALSRIQEQVPRKIFWGQTKVVIFGEEVAKDGIREQLDYFSRHPQLRLRIHAFVCKGRARDILEVLPPLEKSSAEAARELAKMEFGLNITISDLLQMLKGESRAAALPRIEEVPAEVGGKLDQTTIRLNGTAVFREDKMIGFVDDEVTRGILWLRDEISTATVTVEPNEAKGRISLEMIRAKTKLIPQIEQGKWKMTVKVQSEDDVVQNETNLDMNDLAVVDLIKRETEKDLEDRIKLALKLVQKEMKADIFGFAEAFHRTYPKEWAVAKDRWDQIFPNVEVKVDATVYVHRPGVSTQSSAVPDSELKGVEHP